MTVILVLAAILAGFLAGLYFAAFAVSRMVKREIDAGRMTRDQARGLVTRRRS